jgi:hypothetical protein
MRTVDGDLKSFSSKFTPNAKTNFPFSAEARMDIDLNWWELVGSTSFELDLKSI